MNACTYIIEPIMGRRCGEMAPIHVWLIYLREGTGHHPVETPLVRCRGHLPETLAYLLQNDYPTMIDHVERSIPWAES